MNLTNIILQQELQEMDMKGVISTHKYGKSLLVLHKTGMTNLLQISHQFGMEFMKITMQIFPFII